MNVEEIQAKVVSDDYAIAELLKIENSNSRLYVLAIEDTIPKLMGLNNLSGYNNVMKHLEPAPLSVSIKVLLDMEIGSTLFDIKAEGDILVAFWVPHATIGLLPHVLVLFICNWVDTGQVFWALYDRGKLGVYSFSRVLLFSFVDGFLFLNIINAEAKLPTPIVVKSEDWDECASALVKLHVLRFINQQINLDAPNVRPRVLASVDLEKDFDPLPTGETGDNSLTSIPFQVLSWYPRALYFPNFASIEQCQSIIKIAKANLEPSSLALRKGETEETTNGIRTSSGTFISASEDKTGVLDLIEEKIAKATMIPKTHGEAFNILRYEIGQRYQSHYDAFDPAQYGPQKSQRVLLQSSWVARDSTSSFANNIKVQD
ncbi:putative prolyl 4-hydroxylase 9 [Capsicum annuum]|nr:putative prolyl 4-hydroxylase 9 [Capsicum annuum]